jgi:hypothetical protein
MSRACAVLTVLPMLLLAVGCDGQGKAIDFVVPKTLAGPIWLIVTADAPEIPVVNGHYQVMVPANGVLHVRSTSPFEQWHRSSAKFDDGSALPVADQGEGGPDAIALRGGSGGVAQTNGKTTHWMAFYVGTAKQHADWSSADFFADMPK